MKVLYAFMAIVCLAASSCSKEEDDEGYCLKDTTSACREIDNSKFLLSSKMSFDLIFTMLHLFYSADQINLKNCNASFSGFAKSIKHIQQLTNLQLSKSFDYLLVSANFGTFVKNRPGFEKLFHHLSDIAWANTINLIKFMGKRGGIHNFREQKTDETPLKVKEINEIFGLTYSLDAEKYLANQTDILHRRYSSTEHPKRYDAEVSEKKILIAK